MMDGKIIIDCDGINKENFDELYHQLSLKIEPYGATIDKEFSEISKEKKIGSILITAEGLRKLAKAMDMIYSKQVINLPIWKFGKDTYFQLDKGTGAINLK